MPDSHIAAVRIAFGSTNPMPCLRGSPSKKGEGIYYHSGVSLEIVRWDEVLRKHMIQEFTFGALGAHNELFFSSWGLRKEQLNLGAHYCFAGLPTDVRFPNRIGLDFNSEKSLQRGRLALLNHRGGVAEFQGPSFLVKYEELEIQRGNLMDIWSAKVIGKRGQSGCAVPGSPLADLIETYKTGGYEVSLETPDLELMQKLSGEVPEGELYMPVVMCDNPIPQAIHAVFSGDYSQWTVVSVASLREYGLDRTLKEFDENQIARAERKAAQAERAKAPPVQKAVLEGGSVKIDCANEVAQPAAEAAVAEEAVAEEAVAEAVVEETVVTEEPALVSVAAVEPAEEKAEEELKPKKNSENSETPVTE